MFFGNGWKEFTEAHDLCVGYFLVFCHEGNMVFTVKVFDWSGCLKEYNEIAGRFSEETKTTVEEDQAIDNASKSEFILDTPYRCSHSDLSIYQLSLYWNVSGDIRKGVDSDSITSKLKTDNLECSDEEEESTPF